MIERRTGERQNANHRPCNIGRCGERPAASAVPLIGRAIAVSGMALATGPYDPSDAGGIRVSDQIVQMIGELS